MSENTQEQATPPAAPRGGFSTRWRAGESGNPGGRPLGSLDARTVAIRDQLVGVAQEAADALTALMRQDKLKRTKLRAAESILDRVGVGRVSRQETVRLDADDLDQGELLRFAFGGELARLVALTDEVRGIFETLRARRDSGAEPVEAGRDREDGFEVFNVGGDE